MDNFLNTGYGQQLLAHLHQIADNIKPLVKELKRANDHKDEEKKDA
jgi:hypothetical protein